VAIKNGTNAKIRLKIESKRPLMAENFVEGKRYFLVFFEGCPTRSTKNGTNNVFFIRWCNLTGFSCM
jgi:hypothetical protein